MRLNHLKRLYLIVIFKVLIKHFKKRIENHWVLVRVLWVFTQTKQTRISYNKD
jgi:hypothetical protein